MGGAGQDTSQVAALFVEVRGVYASIAGVELWDVMRDARTYEGHWPVVAHPPCARWSRLAGFAASRGAPARGDDGGCFAAALAAVRAWGGVLEHPAGSSAWRAHGLMPPPARGGWVAAGDWLGWTCQVDQGWYGHRCPKATWLYAARVRSLPSLRWGRSSATGRVAAVHSASRVHTPPEFAALLVDLARSVGKPKVKP